MDLIAVLCLGWLVCVVLLKAIMKSSTCIGAYLIGIALRGVGIVPFGHVGNVLEGLM